MRVASFRPAVVALVAGLGAVSVVVQGQAPRSEGGGVRILERAPSDRSVNLLGETLSRYLREMDAHNLATLRMVEGGKYNVNIRRIRGAETALVHPKTIDTWVVLEGDGTMTTGGKIEQSRIVGGVSTPLKAGDVYFVPAGVPHGVSGVNGSVTWLNVRWDVDWAEGAAMGAGTLTPPPPVTGRPSFTPLEYAPADRAVYIPKEKLAAYLAQMEAEKSAVLRMIEGGHFNVNIRRVKAPSAEHHPVTADTWVLLEGGGMVSTGFDRNGTVPVPGTGVSSFARVGDVFYVPANLTHGFTAVDSVAAWLNIRWDVNWAARP
jgi:mannose-6-phosphate isomerase-like protein (cupin superfamily)